MRSMDLLTNSFTCDDEVDGHLQKTPDTVIHRPKHSTRDRYKQGSQQDRSSLERSSASAKHGRSQSPSQSLSPGRSKIRSEVENGGRVRHAERERESRAQHSHSKNRPEAGSAGRRSRHDEAESPSRGTRKTSPSPTRRESDLALQLQRVVRGELRRMMEVCGIFYI